MNPSFVSRLVYEINVVLEMLFDCEHNLWRQRRRCLWAAIETANLYRISLWNVEDKK